MGKGDKRSTKGKIFKGSYGKTRPHDPAKRKAENQKKTERPQRPSGR